MSTYTSQGTIRVHYNFGKINCSKVFFVPDSDYSIKHGKKTFAVFVLQFCDDATDGYNNKTKTCDNAVIKQYDRDSNGVEIDMDVTGFTELVIAATHQTKVEVQIKETVEKVNGKLCSKLKITSITVPAK